MTASEEVIEERLARKSRAIAQRIRSAMGTLTQGDLADRAGKGASTVSDHLSGRANLTLRTIIEYAVALDEEIISVPEVTRPRKRRRRSSEGRRRVSKQRKELEKIDPVKRKLHRFLTTLTARIGQIIEGRDDLSQQVLAKRIGKDPSYVSRALAGGVNLTLRTIVQFEEALGECILRVKGVPSQGTFTGTREASDYVRPYRSSNDGCYLDDNGGRTSTGMTNWLEAGNADCASDEPETMAA
jgi:transcriptional regulator with XRE-family HTH domain